MNGREAPTSMAAKEREGEEKGEEEDASLIQMKAEVRKKMEELTSQVEQIEQQVNDVTTTRASLSQGKFPISKPGLNMRDCEKDKITMNWKQQQHAEAVRREAANAKRMAELIRQFGTILRQITSHKWAWPFMEPVDVKGLELHDYYDVIKKPMDLGTVRNRMDAKDSSGYKHVQEVCDDVRLVFRNAMMYNQEGTDVHVMAKTLLEKFEDKWKNVLEPKVIEENAKRRQEEQEAQSRELEALHYAEEAATEKLAGDLMSQLDQMDSQLEMLRQQVAAKCRMMTIEEKRQLGQSLSQLPPEDLTRAIQMIAQKNPDFIATGDEVELDIDALDASTLWRLQHFVRAVMISQSKGLSTRAPLGVKLKRTVVEASGKPQKRFKKSSP